MAIPVNKLKGVSDDLEARLKKRGIFNSAQLLDAARTPASRRELAESVGVEPRNILELTNRADLARIKGIGGVFSDLLEHAGVDTVKELAMRRADNLYAKLLEVNAQQKLAGRAPTQTAVEGWVAQAKSLPTVLEY
jgi:predicted flap endonuclease-1-like 5' DNA nuclease